MTTVGGLSIEIASTDKILHQDFFNGILREDLFLFLGKKLFKYNFKYIQRFRGHLRRFGFRNVFDALIKITFLKKLGKSINWGLWSNIIRVYCIS
jgi:hypothetical protein